MQNEASELENNPQENQAVFPEGSNLYTWCPPGGLRAWAVLASLVATAYINGSIFGILARKMENPQENQAVCYPPKIAAVCLQTSTMRPNFSQKRHIKYTISGHSLTSQP